MLGRRLQAHSFRTARSWAYENRSNFDLLPQSSVPQAIRRENERKRQTLGVPFPLDRRAEPVQGSLFQLAAEARLRWNFSDGWAAALNPVECHNLVLTNEFDDQTTFWRRESTIFRRVCREFMQDQG